MGISIDSGIAILSRSLLDGCHASEHRTTRGMAEYGLIEGGGTKFVLGIADAEGAIRARQRVPTTTPVETLNAAVAWFQEQRLQPKAIGIACFGPLELDRGLPQWGH